MSDLLQPPVGPAQLDRCSVIYIPDRDFYNDGRVATWMSFGRVYEPSRGGRPGGYFTEIIVEEDDVVGFTTTAAGYRGSSEYQPLVEEHVEFISDLLDEGLEAYAEFEDSGNVVWLLCMEIADQVWGEVSA